MRRGFITRTRTYGLCGIDQDDVEVGGQEIKTKTQHLRAMKKEKSMQEQNIKIEAHALVENLAQGATWDDLMQKIIC